MACNRELWPDEEYFSVNESGFLLLCKQLTCNNINVGLGIKKVTRIIIIYDFISMY